MVRRPTVLAKRLRCLAAQLQWGLVITCVDQFALTHSLLCPFLRTLFFSGSRTGVGEYKARRAQTIAVWSLSMFARKNSCIVAAARRVLAVGLGVRLVSRIST